jgi:hypothetical protein
MSRPSGPFLPCCCGDTNTIVPPLNEYSRTSIPDLICTDSLDKRVIPLQVPVTSIAATGQSYRPHPVAQAQPDFKLDLKLCFSFELALQNYVTVKNNHIGRRAPPSKNAMEDPSEESKTKTRGQEQSQQCNILGPQHDCCMAEITPHTDKEMIRKCPYQDVITTRISLSSLSCCCCRKFLSSLSLRSLQCQ